MTVTFGKRQVGGGASCFITFEAGPTHDGLESAKRLVTLAAEAGGDAVKFQIFDPDRLVADRAMPFTYEVLVDRETGRTESVTEPLYDILVRRCMPPDDWRALKRHADQKGIAFFATVGFEDDIHFVMSIGCDSIKISSADVNHVPLLKMAARTGLCLQIDTGNATIGEIETAVDVIRAEGNENIIIHHCPSGYPARLESINLNVITTLKQMFPYAIAYSDHTPGWEMDVAALALGVDLIEKSITTDRTIRSVEHIFSLEPSDMASFIKVVRDVETAMGRSRRLMFPAELERRANVRRSAHLTASVRAGTALADAAIEYRRPGLGLSPDQVAMLGKLPLAKDLPAGHRVGLDDLVNRG
jgi:N,N'-diacetyllegionaminate synthase